MIEGEQEKVMRRKNISSFLLCVNLGQLPMNVYVLIHAVCLSTWFLAHGAIAACGVCGVWTLNGSRRSIEVGLEDYIHL